jgi:trans-aconitate 2-methyltransferase
MDPGSRACLRCARSSGLSSRRGLLSDTRPPVRRVDIWESEYLHVLEGDNPVFDWTKGTALRPYLDVLDESDRGAFLATYATRISAAYQKQLDGRTLLPFRRIFLIAQL